MNNLYLFFIALLMLNFTPGNDMLFVASRSVSQGVKGGIVSSLGVCAGCFVHIMAAVLGLSIIISRSAYLFQAIKFAGAGYLIYLGIKSLLTNPSTNILNEDQPKTSYLKLFKRGAITNALNPKVAVFFLSFLPQFINPSSSYFRLQLFTLGVWVDVQGTLVLILVACIFGKSRDFFKKHPKALCIQEKITGLVLVGLGVRIAFLTKK
jgi:threonine/homoserine/homoserine lactone efflux protein